MTTRQTRELHSWSELDLTQWIRPGDGVFWSQACSEPVGLIDKLIEQGEELGALDVFCGHTFRERLTEPGADGFRIFSHGTLGRLARIADTRLVRVIPTHYSELPRLFAGGALPSDVALLQLAPPDADGRCSFGMDAGYVADAVKHARVVIAEINEQMPSVAGEGLRLEDLDVAVHTSRPVLQAPQTRPSPIDEEVARHVASLVRDGDTIQIGVGGIPDAVLSSLRHHRDLAVHSGIISDPIIDLIEGGVVTGARKPCDRGRTVAGSALGTQRLVNFLGSAPDIDMRSVNYTHRPEILAQVGRLVAINSAIEVDLTGQVNSESISGRPVGAVGGQVDFLRAARASGGVGVVALPATVAKTGATRIVAELSGPVTTARSDVDVIVTEHGIATLAGLDLKSRAAALIAIAAPEHRDTLHRLSAGASA